MNQPAPHFIEDKVHFLVINLKYLGDSIWMLPFIENLKRNRPDARISVVVNEGTEAFFVDHPAIDNLIRFPRKKAKQGVRGVFTVLSFIRMLRRLKPDVLLDLTFNDRAAIIGFFSGIPIRISFHNRPHWRRHLYTHLVDSLCDTKHTVEYLLDMLRFLGMTIYDTTLRLPIPENARESLRKKFPAVFDSGGKKKVLVHPGARIQLREWNIEHFARVINGISDRHAVFVTVGPGEKTLLDTLLPLLDRAPAVLAFDLSLPEFAALCEQCDIFLGNDSGPIHIAAAFTFAVGLYGPNLSELAGPWTARKIIFENNGLSCRPCRQMGCSNPEFKACLNGIDPEAVIAAIDHALRKDQQR